MTVLKQNPYLVQEKCHQGWHTVLPDQVWGKLALELRVRGALSVQKDLLLDDVG